MRVLEFDMKSDAEKMIRKSDDMKSLIKKIY